MRNDKHTGDMMSILMGILNDECVGGVAAAGFDIIMRDSEQVNLFVLISNHNANLCCGFINIIMTVVKRWINLIFFFIQF